MMIQGKFNADLLSTARQYRGLSQTDLSKIVGVTQGYYSRIEHGILPDLLFNDSIKKIAKALDFPVSFFYQDDRILGLPISIHPMYRKSSGIKGKSLNILNAELNIRAFQLKRLLKIIELEPQIVLPQLEVEDIGSACGVAEIVRKAWMLPRGPLQNLTELVEMAGCIVVWCDFGIPVDGVTVKYPDLPHCVFLNKSAPPDRMRFSLAHELGHIVMHKIPTDKIEEEANQFASELLMPKKDIKKYLSGKLTIEKLVRLKLIWKVSIQALMYRAKQVEAISHNQYIYLKRKINENGWQTREPPDTDFPYEEPSTYMDIVKMHVNDMGYSEKELKDILHSSTIDIHKFYGNFLPNKKVHLRLVN